MSTDTKFLPDTDEDLQPTPGAPEKDTTAAPVLAEHPAARTTRPDHTPGGLPAIPLAVIASNTTVAGLSALAVGTSPAIAAATFGGTLVTAAAMRVAGSRKRAARLPAKPTPKTAARQPAATARPSAASTTGRPGPAASATRRTPASSPSRGATSLGMVGRPATKTPAGKTVPSQGRHGSKTTHPGGRTASAAASGNKAPSRAAQIRALRKEKTAGAPSRRERRTADLNARRSLRDARRTDRKAQTPATQGKATDTLKKPLAVRKGLAARASSAVDAKRDHARTWSRTKRDGAALSRTERIRRSRAAAKSKAAMRRNIARSVTGFAGKAVGAAVIAAPAAALGTITTPLGRKLGWAWLMHPGRRLFRRLTATAHAAHLARVHEARKQHKTNLAALDDTTDPNDTPIADTVARAPQAGAAPDITGDTDMSEDIKLHFLDASAEMESAARAYEPGGMMHVRQVIRAMPVAFEAWANTFAALAEKSDDAFPVGNEIGEGFDDIHQALRALVARGEELAQTFDQIHDADIQRLIAPRKSHEAEKGWDLGNNEDYGE